MLKRMTTFLAAAALVGGLPLLGSASASATPQPSEAPPAAGAAFTCDMSKPGKWIVTTNNAPVRHSFSSGSKIRYRLAVGERIQTSASCTNSAGNPWHCIKACKIDDSSQGPSKIEGHWIFQGHLKDDR